MQVGQTIGPFVIDKVLGSGAMGAVYRARWTKNNARVAVKVIGAGLLDNAMIRARFDREAKILKQLDHPNIVRYYGSGKADGKIPFYAMEYIEGESLDAVLSRRQRFSWEDVINLGRQLCDALQHAHEKGIIHRDIKPSNLMVLADGTLKLTDFGIAKDTDVTALTAANCTVGTASYMSPEQCRGVRDLTHKSDLYSAGVVFYELLTGRKPFTAETPLEMFTKHLKEEPEARPAVLVKECPIWLDTLIMQMLEKDPDRRPRDAAMVSEALGEIAEKVRAQHSAGVDAARGRRVDRARHAPDVDETDKEAARALRGGKGKKRKKKAAVPFYRRLWFQIAGAAVVVLLLSGAVYLMVAGGIGAGIGAVTGPPKLDDLYAEAKPLMESGELDQLRQAREGPLTKFEHHYAASTDDKARQMREWINAVDVAEKQSKLDKLVRSATGKLAFKIDPLPGAETLARDAAVQETKGNVDDAVALWRELAQKYKPEGPDRGWALMAEARVRAYDRVAPELKRLADIARDPERVDVLGYDKAKTEQEKKAVEALELELKGQPADAREAWQKFRDRVEENPNQRLWYYMAVKKEKELAKATPKDK